MSIDKVKKHFQGEAKEFDGLVLKLIPYYRNMMEALVGVLPFDKGQPVEIVDLGSGTGQLALVIKKAFPAAKIVCIDLAENMLDIAREKLKGYKDISYWAGDFCEHEFTGKYDAVVSSLSLHHIFNDGKKAALYRKVYDSLKDKGVFYNIDVILASNVAVQEVYLEKWKQFMLKTISPEEIDNRWIPKYEEEDNPRKLTAELKWLEEAGFKDIDVIWKYYNFVVYGGQKY